MPTKRKLQTEVTGPLQGIRIIDLTSVVLGAYATGILGDLGADVIKVESPLGDRGNGGDVMRWAGDGPNPDVRDLGPIFMTINRNKRSLLLDLRDDKAKQTLRRLIKTADVFCANVRYEGLKRMGMSYEDVKAIKPDIVYVHAAGYGSEGPYAGDPAYDDLIQAGAGFGDIASKTDGDPTPRYVPTLVADKVSGLFMSQAIMAGVIHKQRTGEGQFIEVPMLETMTTFLLAEHLFNRVYDPNGAMCYTRVANVDRKPFKTKDGYVGLMPYNNRQWDDFFALDGRPGLVSSDPRFANYETRTKHIGELYAMVEEVSMKKTTQEWLDILRPLSIPVVKLNRLEDLMTDPHLDQVGLFESYNHPEVGDYTTVRSPFRFSKTPANIRRHPPRLGEHTEELTAEADKLPD